MPLLVTLNMAGALWIELRREQFSSPVPTARFSAPYPSRSRLIQYLSPGVSSFLHANLWLHLGGLLAVVDAEFAHRICRGTRRDR